jgi:uncharacterized protein YndB with AHSA1/START domain
MPVKRDEDGRRYVEAEAEVPGSSEEVWRAIATGEGISSWFVPSKVEEREGGTTVTSFGPGMDAVATITQWNPPHGFTAESQAEPGEEAPATVATEWIVEARGGGMCVVRVVHRWFADSDDWDGQFEGHAYGWATSFFWMLRQYLSHFAGQKCATYQLSAPSDKPAVEITRTIKGALNVVAGTRRFASTPETPEISGIVERIEITDPELLRIRETSPQVVAALEGMEGEEPELFLRLDRPAPGLAHVMIIGMGDQTLLSMRFHLFGADGAAVAPEAEREWSGWLARRFQQLAPQ